MCVCALKTNNFGLVYVLLWTKRKHMHSENVVLRIALTRDDIKWDNINEKYILIKNW